MAPHSLLAHKLATALTQASGTTVKVLDVFSSSVLSSQLKYMPSGKPNIAMVAAYQQSKVYETLVDMWKSVLNVSSIDESLSFFDNGGNSLLVSVLHSQIVRTWTEAPVKIMDLFNRSTLPGQVALLEVFLPSSTIKNNLPPTIQQKITVTTGDIAIIGIAGRFPHADDPDELYRLLAEQQEALHMYSDVGPSNLSDRMLYIPKRVALKRVHYFNAEFWGIKDHEVQYVFGEYLKILLHAYLLVTLARWILSSGFSWSARLKP